MLVKTIIIINRAINSKTIVNNRRAQFPPFPSCTPSSFTQRTLTCSEWELNVARVVAPFAAESVRRDSITRQKNADQHSCPHETT
jgi:hypothetical protein